MDRNPCLKSSSKRCAKRYRPAMYILFLICVTGCGSTNGLVSVTGKVTYQGKSLDHGSITFVSRTSRQATGEIERGEIVGVTTIAADDGIAAGEYLVAITSRDRSEQYKNSMTAPSVIPLRYADILTSDLKATVQPNHNNVLQFDLE
jgi:hypothetical protein